ncbi:MAG TPA: pentapeptide repeat-containing protein, partial [Burkholderiales bacterium]|nr:pentapeptide repeat-containing protein [Burkholderiales bacterium]
MKFEIKHRFTGAILFALECGSLKICVEAAVKARAYLTGANLTGANLAGADLTRANLAGADLA